MLLTMRRLHKGVDVPLSHRVNYLTMLVGFILHTAFLYLRGEQLGRCPLTSPFETTTFVAWAATLVYLIIGPAYRLSFLGAFTAPLVVALEAVALLALNDLVPERLLGARSPWIEFHAAIAILSYGAFALACVCSAMYLVQERQLKSRKLNRSFLLLPSIEQLDQMTVRLVILGLVMLTTGVVGGIISFQSGGHASLFKMVLAGLVWVLYAGILLARYALAWWGRRVAWMSVVSFAVVLIALWSLRLA